MSESNLEAFAARAEDFINRYRPNAPIYLEYLDPALAINFNDFLKRELLPEPPILCEFCPAAVWIGNRNALELTCTRLHDVIFRSSYAERKDAEGKSMPSVGSREYPRDKTGRGVVFCTAYELSVAEMREAAEQAAADAEGESEADR